MAVNLICVHIKSLTILTRLCFLNFSVDQYPLESLETQQLSLAPVEDDTEIWDASWEFEFLSNHQQVLMLVLWKPQW